MTALQMQRIADLAARRAVSARLAPRVLKPMH